MNNSEKLYFLKSDLAKFMRQIYTSTKVNLSDLTTFYKLEISPAHFSK
jgi:hypothetical protein